MSNDGKERVGPTAISAFPCTDPGCAGKSFYVHITCTSAYAATVLLEQLCTEIDAGRPFLMNLGVESDKDGKPVDWTDAKDFKP